MCIFFKTTPKRKQCFYLKNTHHNLTLNYKKTRNLNDSCFVVFIANLFYKVALTNGFEKHGSACNACIEAIDATHEWQRHNAVASFFDEL